MSAPVSALYAGSLALLLLGLAARVSLLRSKLNVGTGHGNDPTLARAIRVHGNAVEWILPMLALLLIAEIEHSRRIAGFGNVDLPDLVREVGDLYEPIAEDKQVELRVLAADPQILPVRGDRR